MNPGKRRGCISIMVLLKPCEWLFNIVSVPEAFQNLHSNGVQTGIFHSQAIEQREEDAQKRKTIKAFAVVVVISCECLRQDCEDLLQQV